MFSLWFSQHLFRTEEVVQFENIQARQSMRRFRREDIEDSEEEQEDEKNLEERELLEWYTFFKKNEEAKSLLNMKNPDLYVRCMDKDVEEEEKRRMEQAQNEKRREEQKIQELENQKLAEKGKICVCEYDTDCKYCSDVYENEKDLYEPNPFSKEEESEFERQELEAYKKNIREERNEKRRKKAELARQPMPALPEREMCLYERIREDNIAERKREWAKFEIEWEKKEQEKKEQDKKEELEDKKKIPNGED